MKKIRKFDIRDLSVNKKIWIADGRGCIFFLEKVSDSKKSTEQNDIVRILNAGKVKIVSDIQYDTRPIGNRKLLNPIIRTGYMLVVMDFEAFSEVYSKRCSDCMDVARELSGSISSIGPIKSMGLL